MSHFDPDTAVEIYTDASAHGVAAVCVQRQEDEEKVIAYASRALNKAQRNYGATELELFGVAFGVEKFHYYVQTGIPFTVFTDDSATGHYVSSREDWDVFLPVFAGH